MKLSKQLINADSYKQQIDIRSIADKLSSLLDEREVTTKLLSEATGISVTAINSLKRAEGNPTLGTLNALASFFNISLLELLGLDDEKRPADNMMAIPIYDLRNASRVSEETIHSKMLFEIPANININTIYGVLINNNSFLPFYEKGTIFIVSKDQPLLEGDIVLVQIQNSLNTFKRYFSTKDGIHLKNIGLDNGSEFYKKGDVNILGIVVQIIQNLM